jgi:hypothetical protein
MLSFLSTSRVFILVLTSACVLLQACASAEKPKPEMQIGMYYDAALEFIMEYPLSWNKDRRLVYGSKEGEVRWTHPGHPATLLRVRSSLMKQHTANEEMQIEELLHEYPDLKILCKEKVRLPAGEAWHVSGQMSQGHLELYLFLRSDHLYVIAFTAGHEDRGSYQDDLERFTNSFQIMP